ncbi:hypothetical protein JL720_3963 [Aureococcus anophagefferens]|nr:hypothetical protein JL720_3963 [Aureococcus anophagefferens]
MDHEADFAPETLAMFDTVSLHLAPVTGRDAAACRRAICVAALFSGCPGARLRVHGALLDVVVACRRGPAYADIAATFARDLLAVLDAHDGLAALAADPLVLARRANRERAADEAFAALLADAPRLADAPTRKRARDDDGA